MERLGKKGFKTVCDKYGNCDDKNYTLVIKMAEMMSKMATLSLIILTKCDPGWQLLGHPAHAWRGCWISGSEVNP